MSLLLFLTLAPSSNGSCNARISQGVSGPPFAFPDHSSRDPILCCSLGMRQTIYNRLEIRQGSPSLAARRSQPAADCTSNTQTTHTHNLTVIAEICEVSGEKGEWRKGASLYISARGRLAIGWCRRAYVGSLPRGVFSHT